MNRKKLLALILLGTVLSCGKSLEFRYPKETEFLTKPFAPLPQVKFITMSDLHYYDNSLGTSGIAYSNYILEDRKLLTYSDSLLNEAVGIIDTTPAEFVLVCGDLTKDGEKICHEKVASYLAKIEQSGKKVYVIPGNHDILNPDAARYEGDKEIPVDSVSEEEFVDIYKDFGFAEAVNRDTNSLSYIAEPIPGLWILCLDSTDHKDNIKLGTPVIPGHFSQATINWIENTLHLAVVKDKAVIAVMHHGAVEHWKGQSKIHPEYLVDEYQPIAKMLAAYHVRAVFTGHYHANDITLASYDDGRFIFDIETGSLVTYPCPLRMIEIGANQKMNIKTVFIDSIPEYPGDLKAYAKEYVSTGLAHIIEGKLKNFWVSPEEASRITPLVVEGYLMHYAGEDTNIGYHAVLDGLSLWGGIVFENQRFVIDNVRSDMEPPDNDVVLDLTVGAWTKSE